MTRLVRRSRRFLLLWTVLSWTGIAAAQNLSVSGAVVEVDAPATYRLPAVSPIVAPAAPANNAPANKAPIRISRAFPPPLPGAILDEMRLPSPPAVVEEERALVLPPPEASATSAAEAASEANTEAATAQPSTPPPAPEPVNRALSQQLLPAVQRGFDLAQRGALFAARTEFIQVLRRVAQARDAVSGSDARAQALAAGLRALDEADDFVPGGVQLEAELDIQTVASSHRTPVLHEREGDVLPHEATALYHNFAQQQLTVAAANEQAGSMALYGLGRIHAQLAERKDDDVRYVRGAMTMYAAALGACPDNHLAANELGVLLCRTGHAAEAVKLFQRTIDLAPTATAYHNLAVAQQKLGMYAQAQANEQHAERLAAWERSSGAVSRRAGVHWVAPDDLARAAQPAELTPTAMPVSPAPPAEKSTWQRARELTKSLPRPGSGSAKEEVGPGIHVARPAHPPNAKRAY